MTQKAFVFASRCGSDSIQTLNRHNANINNQEYEGYTALLEVAGNQEIEAAKSLLANGANANVGMKSSSITPLGISASQGDERLTRLLLEYGAKIDSQNRQGFSALHLAVRHNQLNIVRMLFERGGNVENVAGDGRTPLTHAAAGNQREMVELLLEFGAKVDVQDDCGCTPLALAVYNYASADVIRLLLDNKADIYQTDNTGMNAFDEAQQGAA